jgi:hypothetical protein
VVTPPQPPSLRDKQQRSQLTQRLIALAEMPDDGPQIDSTLLSITQLTADLVDPVTYASVTGKPSGAPTTVAASSDVAVAIDEAQYLDDAGPCLEALKHGQPMAVPDITATMIWPGFRQVAYRLGLRASLSVPLFAGRGSPIAALNLYGRDRAAMGSLRAAVWAAYDTETASSDPDRLDALDPGSVALVAGLTGALGVRSVIQQAIGVVIAHQHASPDAAYVALRLRAAETGLSLVATAASVISEQQQS